MGFLGILGEIGLAARVGSNNPAAGPIRPGAVDLKSKDGVKGYELGYGGTNIPVAVEAGTPLCMMCPWPEGS